MALFKALFRRLHRRHAQQVAIGTMSRHLLRDIGWWHMEDFP